MRIICEDGGVRLTLRDDCPAFDPVRWLDLYAPEDPVRSVGLKLVRSAAKEMSCTSSLGMNVVNIKL